MRLKYIPTMATAVEQLVIDSKSRFLEMKSLQPYSTTDEYLYAMKEDLADWLSNMYPDWRPITADTFIECLENGALLCLHANNVNDAARKAHSLQSTTPSSLENCKYRSHARPQTFNARDNVSQFIKWARHVAGVREVLMFESDDLILRKNEKSFILCLLEIARYGAKFGISVPAIIKLEHEIEREIERDKKTDILSSTELKRLERENENDQIDSTNSNKLFQSTHSDDNETNQNSSKTSPSLSNSDEVDRLKQRINRLPKFSNDNSKQRQTSEDSYDSTTSNEVTTTVVTSNNEQPIPQVSRTVEEKENPIVPPASSSQLHKTLVNIVNSCCCAQRFPVIRIGEGKYRIGENGTIIFIRILRYHVMVRVGGGWDTLENYLNKHDPCRRSNAHRRSEHHHHHHHHSDIPILAVPNTNISPSVQKNTPFGKSVTIKTEEFPLTKPSNHDTNLVDAQLFITRDADGHHRIGQITYKSEEDTLNQPPACPHHHNNQSPPTTTTKIKSVRNTSRFTPTSTVYNKQSSPSTDQDYSSLTETTPSKPSSSSSLDFKEESIEQPMKSSNKTSPKNRRVQRYSPVNKSDIEPLIHLNNHPIDETDVLIESNPNLKINKPKASMTESIIDTIDGYGLPSRPEHDFDISDIEDVIKNISNDDTTNMDNDSLESSEGVLEDKKNIPSARPPPPTKKLGGYCSALYLAEKQKFQQEQAANRKKSIDTMNRYSARSNTVPDVVEAVKKEEQSNKPRRKPMLTARRSQSSELIDKTNDMSKLDRDSGFDEQDFRRERLQSAGDDNSSVSSIKSARSSTARSIHIETRENKSYALRVKKLDTKRNANEQTLPLKARRPVSSATRRGSDLIPPTPPTYKYRKNSQPIVKPK